jgi:hypothetical protein
MTETKDDTRWLRKAKLELSKILNSMPVSERADYLNSRGEEILRERGIKWGTPHTAPQAQTTTARSDRQEA